MGRNISAVLLFLCLMQASQLAEAAYVESFVSPDSSFSVLRDFITGAEGSLFVATYTFTSPEIMGMLIDKRKEGILVEVLIEKSPAGGMPDSEEAVLCGLLTGNVPVMLYDGPLRYMHAKYMISDGESLLVTSENLGYTGFFPDGDYGNRGWGAVIGDAALAHELKEIYEDDRKSSIPFACSMGNQTLSAWDPAGAYDPIFERQSFKNQDTELVFSPDSLDGMLGLIESANSSIDVQQFYIYPHWGSVKYDTIESAPNPMLEALIGKARSGVHVRILLDSTYYNMDEETGVNYQTIQYVQSVAVREGIPIEIKAIDLDAEGLAKVHNKGMVVDGRIALVSSINWNENSVMRNRELGLVISGEAAGYYARVFERDWHGVGGQWQDYGLGFLPAMASLAALIIVIMYFSKRAGRK